MPLKLNWSQVFNTTVGKKWWGHIDEASKAAHDCGYLYFSWNGNILWTDGKDTGLTVDDLNNPKAVYGECDCKAKERKALMHNVGCAFLRRQ